MWLQRSRLRFNLALAGGDPEAEVERLVSLGAIRLEGGEDGNIVPADPDGSEFCVHAG